jgi:predicted transcriptional regulator
MPDQERVHRYSAAAVRLMLSGVSMHRLAAALDTTPASVSRWLSGRHPAPNALFTAIAAAGDRDLADEVRQLVPSRDGVPA